MQTNFPVSGDVLDMFLVSRGFTGPLSVLWGVSLAWQVFFLFLSGVLASFLVSGGDSFFRFMWGVLARVSFVVVMVRLGMLWLCFWSLGDSLVGFLVSVGVSCTVFGFPGGAGPYSLISGDVLASFLISGERVGGGGGVQATGSPAT